MTGLDGRLARGRFEAGCRASGVQATRVHELRDRERALAQAAFEEALERASALPMPHDDAAAGAGHECAQEPDVDDTHTSGPQQEREAGPLVQPDQSLVFAPSPQESRDLFSTVVGEARGRAAAAASSPAEPGAPDAEPAFPKAPGEPHTPTEPQGPWRFELVGLPVKTVAMQRPAGGALEVAVTTHRDLHRSLPELGQKLARRGITLYEGEIG